jgi:signal peptidase I
MPGGFSKGDLIIIVGKKNIEIGDIIIFEAESRYPIIHRVVGINPIQTKGDHNPAQLQKELNIEENKIIGTAIAKVPYIGWLKLFLFEIFR